jgi:HEAT repeat protein
MIRTMILYGWLSMMAVLAFGQDKRGGDQPWDDLESQLRHAGVQTNTAGLIQAARSNSNESLRWMAIEVLGLKGEQEAKPALRQILADDSSRFLQETAALALARLKDDAGIPAMQKFMKSSTNPQRQLFLAARLAEFGDPTGYPFVQAAVTSKDEHLKYLSAAALVPFIPFQVTGHRPIDPLERLIALASDKDPEIRKETLIEFSLAVVKGAPLDRLKEVVNKMKHDKEPSVQQAAESFLALWNKK